MTSQINKLKDEVSKLKALLESQKTSLEDKVSIDRNKIPSDGCSAEQVKTFIEDEILLDVAPALNTSSYVNVRLETQEQELALKGLEVNIADQTVYPQSFKIHDTCVNMIAKLWNCPEPDDFDDYGCYPGANPANRHASVEPTVQAPG